MEHIIYPVEQNNREARSLRRYVKKITFVSPVTDPYKKLERKRCAIKENINLIESLQWNVLQCYNLTDTVKSATEKIIQRKRKKILSHASFVLQYSILLDKFRLIPEICEYLHKYDKQLLADSLKRAISTLIGTYPGCHELTIFLLIIDKPDIVVNILQVLLEILKSSRSNMFKLKDYNLYFVKNKLQELHESSSSAYESQDELEILYNGIIKYEISTTSSKYWRKYRNLPRKPLPALESKISLYAKPSSSSSMNLDTEQETLLSCRYENTLVEQALAIALQQQIIASKEDDCDIFGKFVASQLRSLSGQDRNYVIKHMSKVIFEAKIGKAKQIRIITQDEPARNIQQEMQAIKPANADTNISF